LAGEEIPEKEIFAEEKVLKKVKHYLSKGF